MPKTATEAGIQQYVQALTDAPKRIAACTQGLDDAQLTTPPEPKAWSAAEIMGHVRGCAEVWTRSIHDMLILDQPQLTFIHPRDWIKQQQYQKQPFADNFEAYAAEREKLLRVLRGLSSDQWNRSATFTGKVNTFTIYGEVMRMALHDLDHCQQFETMFPE